MSDPPRNVRALRERGEFEIDWTDNTLQHVPFRFLRGRCPCAGCVDEMTGRRVVDVDAIPADILPTEVALTGNYALKITWSDGHNTGLYRWDYLRQLGDGEQPAQPSPGE